MPALTQIEGLSADGRGIEVHDGVRVPAGPQRLSVSYAGISLAVPERVRYRYRLDGFDADWSEPRQEREATYTNLRPGPYRFRVKASNAEGQWTDTEAALAFSIAAALLADAMVPAVRDGRRRARHMGRLSHPRPAGGAAAQPALRRAARRAHAHRPGAS